MSDEEQEVKKYPFNTGSGNATQTGYTIEARMNYIEPQNVCGILLDKRWKRLSLQQCDLGVPIKGIFDLRLVEHDLLPYSAAQALRWWFHASADADRFGGCLETKLIQHKLEENYKKTAISEHMLICGEDRSNCIPDWGKKDE